MYYFISLENIKLFFLTLGLDLSLLSDYEISVIFILSNIFLLLTIIFILFISYKIICRFFRL